jgi:hypothetical protein
VLLPGLTFGALYAWPFLEARVTRDRLPHETLDRPRDRPGRTAIGVGVLSFYIVLLLAGGQDIVAQHLHVSITTVLHAFQIMLFVVPLIAALLAHKLASDLRASDVVALEKKEIVVLPGVGPRPRPTTTTALVPVTGELVPVPAGGGGEDGGSYPRKLGLVAGAAGGVAAVVAWLLGRRGSRPR